MTGTAWPKDLVDPQEQSDLWRRAVAALEAIAQALTEIAGKESS